MAFTINTFPNEPIILIRVWRQSDALEDYPLLMRQLGKLLAGKEGPVYRISDFSEADHMTFSDLVVALGEEYRSGAPGSATDPRIRVVLVTSNDLLKWGAQSAQQQQYGAMEPPPIFSSLDEALVYCRAEIKKAACLVG